MTWNVSASGPKELVKQKISEQIVNDREKPLVAHLHGLVDAVTGNCCTLSASGHNGADDGNMTLSISAYTAQADVA